MKKTFLTSLSLLFIIPFNIVNVVNVVNAVDVINQFQEFNIHNQQLIMLNKGKILLNDCSETETNQTNIFKIGSMCGSLIHENQKYRNLLNTNNTNLIENQLFTIDYSFRKLKENNDLSCSNINTSQWFFDKLDGKFNNSFISKFSGVNTNVYILDTGVQTTHEYLKGHTFNGYDFINNTNIQNDYNGHGTHVAGIIRNVAPSTDIYGVRVLDENGSGTLFNILKGLEWIVNHITDKKKIINMSLGSFKNNEMDNAINEIVNKYGIVVVVSAGNWGSNACNFSPAAANNAITVGSTSFIGRLSSFSNHGPCVNIYAPGSDILSSTSGKLGINCRNLKNKKIRKKCFNNKLNKQQINKYVWASGTSMSAPIISGVTALYLEENPLMTISQVKQKMLLTSDKIIIDPKMESNLYMESEFPVIKLV